MWQYLITRKKLILVCYDLLDWPNPFSGGLAVWKQNGLDLMQSLAFALGEGMHSHLQVLSSHSKWGFFHGQIVFAVSSLSALYYCLVFCYWFF